MSADLDELVGLLVDGARTVFLRAQASDVPIHGYCLYTDEAAQTAVAAVCQADEPPEDPDERWNPHEWDPISIGDGDPLQPAEQWLIAHGLRAPDEGFEAFREPLLDAFVRALQILREEGVFGRGEDQAYVVMSVSEWTEVDVAPWVEALNAPSRVAGYRAWAGL